jgi:arsenate reductase
MREIASVAGVTPRRLTPEPAGARSSRGLRRPGPFIPGARVDDWPLPDPKGRPIEEVRAIRDDIRRRVEAFIVARGWGQRG